MRIGLFDPFDLARQLIEPAGRKIHILMRKDDIGRGGLVQALVIGGPGRCGTQLRVHYRAPGPDIGRGQKVLVERGLIICGHDNIKIWR